MDRNSFLEGAKDRITTVSFSPKGDIYISVPEGVHFPIASGNHPFAIMDSNFFFAKDRFFLYGYTKGTSYYTSSYNNKSESITLYAREQGENTKAITTGTPEELKAKYRLATGVLITAAVTIEKEAFLVDLKFQASSRSNWIDFTSECRRVKKYPDFLISMTETEEYGYAFFFKSHGKDPSKAIEEALLVIV